jgi:hypothetical protein
MSMYTTLLGSALHQRDQSDTGSSIGDLFAQFLRCRGRLNSAFPVGPGSIRTLKAVAEELDYDVALISLARSRNIDFSLDRFDNGERHLLEQALKRSGIRLDALDERT